MTRIIEWPFLGRVESVAAVASTVVGSAARRGVLLRGDAGAGKTSLARAVAAALRQDGIELVECHASTSLATIPFGAMAPLLATLGALDTGRATEADVADGRDATFLASVCDAIASANSLGLLVDDVAHADAGSLAIVRSATLLRDFPVVLTARSTDALPALVAGLVDEGLIDEVEVGPLGRDASDAILERALGGPVDPDTARKLFEASQGNPLYLRELVRGALASKTVVPGPHGFVTGPVPSSRLIELLGERVRRADESERRILELLAAAQPVPVSALGDRSAVDRLEGEGVIAVDGTPPGLLARMGHPLYDDIVRASTPTARWHERLREAAGLLRGQAQDDDAQLRAVDLDLQSGSEVPAAELLRAARRATTLLDHEMTLTLAHHLASAGDSAAALQLQGMALSSLGRFDEAERALRRSLDLACSDEQVARAAQPLAQLLAIRLGRPDDAVAALDAALDRINESAWQAFLAADRARWAMLAGEATTFAGDADQTGASRLNGLMVEALVNLMDGHLSTAAAAIDAGLTMSYAHRDLVPHATELLMLSRCMAQFFSGDLPGAIEFARAELAAAGARNDEPVGMWAYALSAVSLHAGRVEDSLAWSQLAVPRLQWRDFTGLAATAVAVRATALAQQGRTGEARDALAGVRGDDPSDAWATMQCAQADAWCALSEGRAEDASQAVAVAGRRGMESGHLYLGALTSYTAVRFGRAEPVAADLERAANRGEGRLLQVFAGHARALADREPQALADVAGRLDELGMASAAATAIEQSAALLERAGKREEARRLRLRAAQMLHEKGLAPAATGRVVPLTKRELEVAQRAAHRHGSKAIAGELGISVRTVDNHLARIYRKLDVTSRGDLAQMLDDLGLLASDH